MRLCFKAALFAGLGLAFASAHAWNRSQEVVAPGEGAVAYVVALNFPSGNDLTQMRMGLPLLTQVERQDGERKKEYTLTAREVGMQSARAYAGALPAGRYRFPGSDRRDVPEFVVESGKITLLGNLANSSNFDAERRVIERWGWEDLPDAQVASRVVGELFPQLAHLPQRVGWATAESSHVGRDKLAELKENSAGLYQPTHFYGDGFAFGSQLGVVKLWSLRLGAMVLIDTGSMFAIRSVLAEPDGRMLAGGEAGTLRYSGDGGATWKDASSRLPYGAIAQIVRGGDGQAVLALQTSEGVSVYRGPFDGSAWQRLADFPAKFATWTGIPGVMPELFVRADDLIVSLPSRKAAHIRLDSGETRLFDLPGAIQSISLGGDGVLRCRCARSIAVNPWESRDLGRTWQPSQISRYLSLPRLKGDGQGFAYGATSLSAKDAGIWATHDGGANWKNVYGRVMNGVWTTAYSADGSLMLLAGAESLGLSAVRERAIVSREDGKTWFQIGERRGVLRRPYMELLGP
jgi:hypothetical protein